jgi:ASC-1-like (ASCH) protein
MAQQTALEIFWNQIPEILPFTVDTETGVKLLRAFEQAKEMEKQQAFEYFKAGQDSTEEGGKSFEQYYTETYGK